MTLSSPVNSHEAGRAERVELILRQLTTLPTLPAVALRILEATTSEHTSARDVVRLIEADPALTARILSLLKRADLGLRDDVITVERAVVLLGLEAVRNAALAVEVYETFAAAEAGPGSALVRAEFWKHSLAVACAAELVARGLKARDVAPAEAFVCGMLHDIGKIALDACLPKSYARVVRRCDHERACICDVERDVLGLDHTLAGKRLLTHWRLPQPIVESAWLHHHSALPDSVAHRRLVAVVHLADNLVRRQRIGYSAYQHVEPVEALAESVGLAPGHLDAVVQELPARLEAIAQAFGLDDIRSHQVYARSLADANTELSRLNARLADANRRLERRSQCFEALRQFVQSLADDSDVGAVCYAAAAVMGRLFSSPTAVAFARMRADGLMDASVWNGADHHRRTVVFDAAEQLVDVPPSGGAAQAGAVQLEKAHKFHVQVWERLTRLHPGTALWALPIVHARSEIGAVLFEAHEDDAAAFAPLRDECEALSTAFGLAMSSAAARAGAERLSEELLDMNRRLKTAQQALLRTRALSMVAEMAAGAAHELNNPLAVIAGRAQMLAGEPELSEDEATASALRVINDQAARASAIVSELLHFAKPPTPSPARVSLARVFETLWQHYQGGEIARGGRLSFEVSDADLCAVVDPGQLNTILKALIDNALEAADPQKGSVTVNSPSAATDETVRIRVQDDGPGMTADVVERAFDPFFSSRRAGRSRGLGLSHALRLTEINGGRLWLESTLQAGTTAFLELPARPAARPAAATAT